MFSKMETGFHIGLFTITCCNKLLHICWLKITHIYYGSYKSEMGLTRLKMKMLARPHFFWTIGENPFSCLFHLLGGGEVRCVCVGSCIPWFMAPSCIFKAAMAVETVITCHLDSSKEESLVITLIPLGEHRILFPISNTASPQL